MRIDCPFAARVSEKSPARCAAVGRVAVNRPGVRQCASVGEALAQFHRAADLAVVRRGAVLHVAVRIDHQPAGAHAAVDVDDLFDAGRRTRPAFIVEGTVSAPLTLDVNNPNVTVLAHIVGKLLNALQRSQFVDVR